MKQKRKPLKPKNEFLKKRRTMKLFSMDNYLSTVDEKDRAALESLRAYIHELVPVTEEKISYGLAAFYYKGEYLKLINIIL